MKLDDRLIAALADDARVGATIEDIALANDISVASFYKWIAIGRHVIEAEDAGRQLSDAAMEAGASELLAEQTRSLVKALARSAAQGRLSVLRSLDILVQGSQAGETVIQIAPSLSAIKLRLTLDGRLHTQLPESRDSESLDSNRVITPRLTAESLRAKTTDVLSQGDGIAIDAVLLIDDADSVIAQLPE